MRTRLLTAVGVAACASAAASVGLAQPRTVVPPRPVVLKTIQGNRVEAGGIAASVGALMERCGVNGLSVAVLEGGEVAWAGAFGTLTACGATPVTADTVFGAADLSKPVFAYLVMRLVDRAVIDLDTPLFRYLPKPLFTYPAYGELRSDLRFETITARMVLSHRTGFPNWRWQNRSGRLDIKFPPGQRYGYSSEAFQYLQFVLEEKLGRRLQQLASEEVFRPLGMARTSFVLEERFDGCLAAELAHVPGYLRTRLRSEASAASSLLTTAADYGRFMGAVARGEGLAADAAREMLTPQVRVSSWRMLDPATSTGASPARGPAWCLGWGRFETPVGDAIFHTGRDAGLENYAVIYLKERIGMVVLTVGGSREAIAPLLAARLIGDCYSPFDWAGY
jgi:CubicO group peptidase (beta-lactamase class C family)